MLNFFRHELMFWVFFCIFSLLSLFLAALDLIAMLRLSLDTMHRLLTDVDSLVLEHGLQSVWASVIMAHRLSCPMACGISLDQEWNLSPLHWQVDA